MTIQQWLFSFKGRIGRRDFWIWIGLWFAGMLALFSLAGKICLIFKRRHFAWCACCGRPLPSWSSVCMTGGAPARGRC
ncbi:membrane protein [Salmonella enterica subsp. arizonae]|uniref:Membrane protein n=1 Tax=Salmonella enterica subsp. arizonae TaxID=59203 RepID=A0A447RBJ9_SALER|nr:membrane protein [Salmonella enterica subsp. arizonae]